MIIPDIVACPQCGTQIPLSDALRTHIQKDVEQLLHERLAEERVSTLAKVKADVAVEYANLTATLVEKTKLIEDSRDRELALLKKTRMLEEERASVDQLLHERLAEERVTTLAKAKADIAVEYANLTATLAEKTRLVEDSRDRELALLKKTRMLEEERAAMDVDIERRLQMERTTIEQAIEVRLAEQHHLRSAEKEKQLSDLRKQIEDLKRKAEQGSQQTQGEAAELNLEDLLRTIFPQDEITPVPKGIRGADVIQRVMGPGGLMCGSIIWEAKNTKTWSDGWLEKLRNDQREMRADIAAITTTTLPKDITHLTLLDGVWVTSFSTIPGLALALRSQLIQVALARTIAHSRGTKMELLYDYLTGSDFRQRVETVVEAFVAMREDLDRERRAIEKTWATRDKQLCRALSGLAGLYGDMQGLVGSSLPKVAQLEMASDVEHKPLLESAVDKHHLQLEALIVSIDPPETQQLEEQLANI